jgi:hypothetical protein
MKKLALLVTAIAVLAVPAMASAATYNATLTVNLVNEGVTHTFNVQADCTTGDYSGNGDSNFGNTDNESVTGNISTAGFTGHAVYGPNAVPTPYNWDFSLTSADSGVTYTGTGSDSQGSQFTALTGTLTSDKSTACAPPPPPTPGSKDACKKGGWESLFRTNGTPFKNQGDCVSYVANGK